MSDRIPLDRFPETMTITRGLADSINGRVGAEGALSVEAITAAVIEAVGHLEVQVIALKRAVGLE